MSIEQVTDAAIERAEQKIRHIKAIKRLEWRIGMVREWADEEAARLERQLLNARRAYDSWMTAEALRKAAESQAVQS